MQKTKEGQVEICYYKGKISKKLAAFYNPDMQLNRDISVMALQTYQKSVKKELICADILAATGKQHTGRDLAGESAAILPVDILGTQGDF